MFQALKQSRTSKLHFFVQQIFHQFYFKLKDHTRSSED